MKRLVVLVCWTVACATCARGLSGEETPNRRTAAAGPRQTAEPPRRVKGVFALSTGIQPLGDFVMAHPDLTGVSLRAGWNVIEPEAGRFVWPFDAEIARARAAGKQIMLRVSPGVASPDWLYRAGAQAFTSTDTNPHHKTAGEKMRLPIPWDPVFLDKWTALVGALGRKYAADPSVVLVQMVGPNKSGGEMHLPSSPADQAAWIKAGYSKEKLVRAYQAVIDAYDRAFPRTALALDVALPVFKDGAADEIMAYAARRLGPRFHLQHNALAAKTKENSFFIHRLVRSYQGRATIGFQLLCPVTAAGRFNDEGRRFGGTLAEGFQIGLRAGGSYFEIYPIDLKNPAAARDLHALAVTLRGG